MGRSRNRHSGTKHTIRVNTHTGHFENKRDKSETRALDAVRRGDVAVMDEPLPGIAPLLSNEEINEAIREVVGDNDEQFQSAWMTVVERNLNDIGDIKGVSKEVEGKSFEKQIQRPVMTNSELEALIDSASVEREEKPRSKFLVHMNLGEFQGLLHVTPEVEKPHRYYSLRAGQVCPRCIHGRILASWRARVCINCGLRDDDVVTKEDSDNDRILFWAMRNRPSEVDHDPLKKMIHISRMIATGK